MVVVVRFVALLRGALVEATLLAALVGVVVWGVAPVVSWL